MYKIESHVHTDPVSICARISPKEVVRLHKEAGYDTIIIANHFDKAHLGRLGKELLWEERVLRHFQAYEEAKAAGDECGLKVLLSAEITLEKNHFLLYGISKELLIDQPDILDWSVAEFSAYARANGITVVQAHPLREDSSRPYPEYVDGFEVINSSPRYTNHNGEVLELAKKYNLLISAGSDVHLTEDVGGSAMLSDHEIDSIEVYVELLKSGKAKLMRLNEILDI